MSRYTGMRSVKLKHRVLTQQILIESQQPLENVALLLSKVFAFRDLFCLIC